MSHAKKPTLRPAIRSIPSESPLSWENLVIALRAATSPEEEKRIFLIFLERVDEAGVWENVALIRRQQAFSLNREQIALFVEGCPSVGASRTFLGKLARWVSTYQNPGRARYEIYAEVAAGIQAAQALLLQKTTI